MKRVFFTLLLFFIGLTLFAKTKGFVYTDVIKVRDAPSMESNKVGNLYFGDVFYVYKIEGSGRLIDGVYDKWCKISKDSEQWVNYYYISTFPFKVIYEDKAAINDFYKIVLKKQNEFLPDALCIEDIIEENGVKYFSYYIENYDQNYHRDAKNLKVQVSPVIKNFLPPSYKNLLRITKKQIVTVDNTNGKIYGNKENNSYDVYYGYVPPENGIEIGKKKWVVEAYKEDFTLDEMKIQDNPSIRKFNFCLRTLYDFQNYTYKGICLYGIEEEMEKNTIIEILGLPDSISTKYSSVEEYVYKYGHYKGEIYIDFENDIVYRIDYDCEK